MPFLRVVRDKRGYETTYLMDWYREGERQRSHILYVFRSPGGARVGREALDPEVRREIEASYPDIDFDWNAVFKTQQVVDATPPPRRPRKRRPAADTAPGASGAQEPASTDGGTVAPSEPRQPIPSVIEGTTPDERMAFLAQWYAIVRDRVEQRAADPGRRDALLALTERLNPATWTDADQITSGLEQAAEALGRLARVLGRRRRRARRGSREETPRPEPPADVIPTDVPPSES